MAYEWINDPKSISTALLEEWVAELEAMGDALNEASKATLEAYRQELASR
jgi:hypothetical protein